MKCHSCRKTCLGMAKMGESGGKIGQPSDVIRLLTGLLFDVVRMLTGRLEERMREREYKSLHKSAGMGSAPPYYTTIIQGWV